jgi:Flp pilus assembly protein TadD
MNNPFLEQAEWHCLCGAPQEALRVARMGLTLHPDSAALWEIAASCAGELGDHAKAVESWQRLLALQPATAEACNGLAVSLLKLERFAEAEAALRRGLVLLPEDAVLLANLGLALEGLGRWPEAEAAHRRAVELAPTAADVIGNLAGAVCLNGRLDEALALYVQAIELDPSSAMNHSNLGVLLTDMGRYDEAEVCLRRALALQPDYLLGQMNLGQLLLRQGRFEEGWQFYEGRHYDWPGGGASARTCPMWQGEALAGKRILVLPEQGWGDQIQFCRYLGWLKAQGPACVTLLAAPELHRLFAGLAGADRVVSAGEAAGLLAEQDCWTFLMSLPRHAGTRLENVPAPVPYLRPLPLAGATLPGDDGDEVLRVGLVWRGNPRHTNDRERSLPGLETLLPLRDVPGVRFFSLQMGDTAVAAWPDGEPLVDLSPMIHDFADTAALLARLDLLVCVDTSAAHLAGALGVPCWLLLPHYKCDWRWLDGREDSPWYPKTRLFRQPRRGDWTTPVARLVEELRCLRG